MQPELSQSQEPQAPVAETAAEVARPRKPIGKIILLIILILAVGGLGYWNYMLDANLKTANLSLAASQSKYNALTTRNTKLISDLDETNKELERVNTELATTNESLKSVKSEISKINSDISSIKAKKEKASPYITVLFSFFIMPDNEVKGLVIYFLVLSIKDERLTDLYTNYTENPNQANFDAWVGYAITTTGDILRN